MTKGKYIKDIRDNTFKSCMLFQSATALSLVTKHRLQGCIKHIMFELRQQQSWPSSLLSHPHLCNCSRGPGQSKDRYLSITVPSSHTLYLILKVHLAIDFLPSAKYLVNSCWVSQTHYSSGMLSRYQ